MTNVDTFNTYKMSALQIVLLDFFVLVYIFIYVISNIENCNKTDIYSFAYLRKKRNDFSKKKKTQPIYQYFCSLPASLF